MTRFSNFLKYLEVPKDGEDLYYDNDRLTNRDLIPIPPERRTWKGIEFFSYWIVEGVSVSGYTTVSSLVSYGLSVRQSIACAVASGIIYGTFAVILGWVGSHLKIGYPVFSRACFGINGTYFAIIIRTLTGIVWCGVQAYYGGQAVSTALGALSPSFSDWNTFSLTPVGNISSADFIGFILYIIITSLCILIKPEKMQRLFVITFIMVLMSIMGMLIYVMHENHGPGTLLTENSTLHGSTEIARAVVQGIFSIVGSCGTGILGQSDWTRYSRNKNSPVLAQFIGAPIAVTFSGTMGALITSASYDIMGEAIWNPIALLKQIQKYENNSSKARAGVFFASVGFVGQQLAINLMLNIVSSGMDLAGVFPKYLNIRRAGFLVTVISIACCPWFLQANATVVIIFGSGWGAFCSSLTGIFLAKYFFIYKRKVLLSHLYLYDKSSIYWFVGGFDWRAFVAWAVGTGFLIPGLVGVSLGKDWGFWTWIFNISYAWGIVVTGLVMIALHYAFPSYDIPVDYTLDTKYTSGGDLIESMDLASANESSELEKKGPEIRTVTKEL